jgi:hypothetical protein
MSSLLSSHHEARSSANDLHGLSVSFVGEYLNWVDNFYPELLQISGCSPDEVWDVSGKCAKQVFGVLCEIRSIVGNANMEQDFNKNNCMLSICYRPESSKKVQGQRLLQP